MITQGLEPHVSAADEPHVYFLGLPTVIRASGQTTNGAFGLIEQLAMPAGFASPYHTHRLEDEAFYVLEGEVAFVCDGNWTVRVMVTKAAVATIPTTNRFMRPPSRASTRVSVSTQRIQRHPQRGGPTANVADGRAILQTACRAPQQ